MTKEEAISVFKDKLNWANQNRYPYVSQREAEAYRMAIKALEQTGWISVNNLRTKHKAYYISMAEIGVIRQEKLMYQLIIRMADIIKL